MSANDSSTLIDMPAASKLGENRALYYSEEENRIEKFRPYGLPEPEWLEKVKARFASRPVPDVPAPANGAPAAPAPAPVAVAESPLPEGNGAASHGDGNGIGNLDLDGPDRLVESHAPAPAPSVDEPGGPAIE
jgi:S-DNA-T family DNA segregation ATPase FtsK/SpoIIIE